MGLHQNRRHSSNFLSSSPSLTSPSLSSLFSLYPSSSVSIPPSSSVKCGKQEEGMGGESFQFCQALMTHTKKPIHFRIELWKIWRWQKKILQNILFICVVSIFQFYFDQYRFLQSSFYTYSSSFFLYFFPHSLSIYSFCRSFSVIGLTSYDSDIKSHHYIYDVKIYLSNNFPSQ